MTHNSQQSKICLKFDKLHKQMTMTPLPLARFSPLGMPELDTEKSLTYADTINLAATILTQQCTLNA